MAAYLLWFDPQRDLFQLEVDGKKKSITNRGEVPFGAESLRAFSDSVSTHRRDAVIKGGSRQGLQLSAATDYRKNASLDKPKLTAVDNAQAAQARNLRVQLEKLTKGKVKLLQSGGGFTMTHRPLSIALLALPLCVTSPVIAEEDTPVFGQVATTRKTAIKIAPNPHGRGDGCERQHGFALDKRRSQRKVSPCHGSQGTDRMGFGSRCQEGRGRRPRQYCARGLGSTSVSPPTLNACTTTNPTGCAAADSAHGLVNRLKRTVPPEGTPTTLTFETFAQLQSAAVDLVDQGVEIAPAERDKIKSIETADATVGEGSRVRLIAFLSEGSPHANSGDQ